MSEQLTLLKLATLTDIANAVRSKDGTYDAIKVKDLASRIRAISQKVEELAEYSEVKENYYTPMEGKLFR